VGGDKGASATNIRNSCGGGTKSIVDQYIRLSTVVSGSPHVHSCFLPNWPKLILFTLPWPVVKCGFVIVAVGFVLAGRTGVCSRFLDILCFLQPIFPETGLLFSPLFLLLGCY
jgi:hypothetical protein